MATSAYSTFVPVTGAVMNISMGNDCCSQMLSVGTGNGIVNFIIDPAAQGIDSRRLRPGISCAGSKIQRVGCGL